MDDLISREAAVRIIADMHGLCRDDVLHESIQTIKELPAVNAIPIEWLYKLQSELDGPWDTTMNAIDNIIRWWQKEQVNSNG